MKQLTPNHYKIILRDISEGEGGAFEVFAPAFHAYCFGDSPLEALESYYIYFEDEKERREKEKIPMPKSDIMPQKLKQVPLRIPQDVYEHIASTAREKGISFNSMVTGILAGVSG